MQLKNKRVYFSYVLWKGIFEMNISTKRLLSALVVAGFFFAGCSSNGDSSSSQASSISTVVKETLVFGTPTSQALKVVLTNDTGLDIDSIQLAPAETNVTPPELMPENSQWKAGEQAELYLQSADQTLHLALKVSGSKDGKKESYSIDPFPIAALFEAATINAANSASSETSKASTKASSESSSTSDSTLSIQSILKLDDQDLVMTWRQDGETLSSKDYEFSESDPEDEGENTNGEDEEVVVTEEIVTEPAAPQTPAQEPVSEPVYNEPIVDQQPIVQEPVYTTPGNDLYYDDPVYYPPVESTTPSSPAVDPSYNTPIYNPTPAPTTPSSPAPTTPTTPTTPSVPSQSGDNCVNPGDLILNPNA